MMKRIIIWITAMLMLICTAVCAYAEEKPIYASDLKDGAYEIEVTSSSSMFRIVHCELDVKGDGMTAKMTLSGTGYEKLYMGTGEEALAAGDEDYIYFEENPDGEYTYTVPVEALGKDIDCAAFSIRKQEWYDRTLVFEPATLPEKAYKTGNMMVYICVCGAILLLVLLFVLLKRKRK